MKYLKVFMIFLLLGACQTEKRWDYPFPIFGVALDGFPITRQMLDQSVEETKIAPSIVAFYLQWPPLVSKVEVSITPSLEAIWNYKSVPCMTWEPMHVIDKIEKEIPYLDILEGKYDQYLAQVASEITQWGKILIIRLAHEMNLSRYHWGTSQQNYGHSSPDIYISLFRYIVTYFRSRGVNNVLWAFCPNTDSIPNEDWNVVKNYYPGDDYVDILGMDGYNWNINDHLAAAKGQSWSLPWRSFEQIFENLFLQLKKISAKKPIFVFETASTNRTHSNEKLLWVQNAIETAKKWDIQGIVWFQVDKEEKWKLHQDKNILIDSNQPSFQSWLIENVKDFR